MNLFRTVTMAGALALAAGWTLAQGGPGPGPGGPGPGASAPRMGPGASAPRMGPRGGRWGADVTPGWSMMSEQERAEHRQRMQSMNSYEDCKAYRDRHHEQMAARAKERGLTMPMQPRQDGCAGLRP